MRLREIYRTRSFGLSIEIFPPKTTEGDADLFQTLDRLAQFDPGFISCTYGAGGSTRNRTIELCAGIQNRYGLAATAHLTCVGSTRAELTDWLNTARHSGIGNIMALRGDPPEGQTSFQQAAGGLAYANQLVALIRESLPDIGIGVAGYPEKHPEAVDARTDLEHLKTKVDNGADAVFTQLFYANENFFDFRERYERAGIRVPLVPGIMPITDFARIKRITAMCKAVFPVELASRLEAAQDDREAQFEIGVDYAIRQCAELIEQNVPGMHFYVLNRSRACERILGALGLQPAGAEPSRSG